MNKDVLQPLLHVVQAAGAPLAPATPQTQTATLLKEKAPVNPTSVSGVGLNDCWHTHHNSHFTSVP
jgi:hypothetical protein